MKQGHDLAERTHELASKAPMDKPSTPDVSLLSSQPTIPSRRVGPTSLFIEFQRQEIDQSIPQRFERQVAKYPDRLAVKSGNNALTYAELNEAANRLARAIIARHGSGEQPVALLLEHDVPVIIAILAVLKAGKCYVPLEPSYPRARTASILADAHVDLIVTNNKNRSSADELAQGAIQFINMDELASDVPAGNLDLPLSPDALAWILYTSGSTGMPKGVVQNHRNTLCEIRRHT